jgi:hypothetical protein
MKTTITLALLVTVSLLKLPTAHAETTAYLGGWSTHPFSNHDYNESHNLVAVEHSGWTVGFFDNSYDEDTLAAGYHIKPKLTRLGEWQAGAVAGVSYGYRDCSKGWDREGQRRRFCPMLAPSLSYNGWTEATGVKPTFLVLGPAAVVTVGVDLDRLAGFLHRNL